MSNILEDLKPSKNKLYAKHKNPNEDIKELERLREDYLTKKIEFLAKMKTLKKSTNPT